MNATVLVPSENKDDQQGGDKEQQEPAGQDEQEPGTGGGESGGGTEGTGTTDNAPSDSTSQGEGGTEQNNDTAGGAAGLESANPEESGEQTAPAPEGSAVNEAVEGESDSAFIGSFRDIIDAYMIPSTVYAQEETGGGSETTPETKKVKIEGITWKIDPAKSSKEVFSSEKADYSFEYVAVLPAGYTTKAALPVIKVTIEKKNEEEVPSRNKYGIVEYKDDKGLSYTIEDYAAVVDSSEPVTWKDDWYVVGEDAEITGQIDVDGIVNIILTDGHTLKVTDARLVVEDEAVINIFGQEEGTGKLAMEYKKDDELAVLSISDGDFTISGGVVEVSSEKGTAIDADCVVINAGAVKATGKVGIVTKDKLTVLGGQSEFSSIGSEKAKSGDVILDYADEEDSVLVTEGIYLKDLGKVSIVKDKALTDGDVAYEGDYTSASEPAYTVFVKKKLVHAVFEETPKATFTASGTQSAKLKGLVKEAEYEISGAGFVKTQFTAGADGTYKIASGLKVGTLELIKKKTDKTVDSKPQTFTITKAENPSKLTAKACTTEENTDGSITGLDTSKKYEYRALSDSVYTAVSTGASSITGLKNGTYYVRLKPVGTMLASASLKLEIKPYAAKKVTTPTFSKKSGSYTGTQTVTISSTTADAKIYYTIDGTVPSTNSILYTGAITVDKSMTIKAFAVKEGMTNSSLASATYSITTTTTRSSTSGSSLYKSSGSSSKSSRTTTSKSSSSKSSASKSSTTGTGRISSSLSDSYSSSKSSDSYSSGKSSSRGSARSLSDTYAEDEYDDENEYPVDTDDISRYVSHDTDDALDDVDPSSLYEVPDVTSNESDYYYADGDLDDMEMNDIYNEDAFDLEDVGFGLDEYSLPTYIAIFVSVAAFAGVLIVCLKNKKSISVQG